MTSIENLYDARVEDLRVLLEALENVFYDHLTGPAVVHDGERCCALPEKQADLAFLLVRTGASLLRTMSKEVGGVE